MLERSAHVVEGSFHSTRQPHMVIEPDVAQAYVDKDGVLTIHCKSLYLQALLANLPAAIGYPKEKMRVIENPTGASFGYSLSAATAGLVSVATLATGRPVSLVLSYEEYMHFTGKRAPSYSNARLGCDENGKLTALEFDIAFDKGAYSETASVLIQKGLRFYGAPYYIPSVRGLSKAVFSNHAYSTSYRASVLPSATPAPNS